MPIDRSVSPLNRTKTAAQWTAENPYLHRGDWGIESDTGKFKLGAGARWADTSYVPTASSAFVAVPASASSQGTAGQMAYTGTHLYICTATDTWRRVAIATWVDPAATLLLHFDGANNSTTFTDSSSIARTVTRTGDAKISTAQSKFGGASGLFDGGVDGIDYLSVAASAGLQPLGGDFTVEFWWYPLSNTRQGFFSAETDFWLGVDYWRGYIGMWAGSGSGWNLIESDTSQGRGATPITLNQWHHIAYTRTGNVWRLFLNGALEKKVTASGSVVDRSAEGMVIGAWAGGSDYPVDGYMDEFRYIVGHSVYNCDSCFAPPTSPFPF